MESNLYEKMSYQVPKAKRKLESFQRRYNVVLHDYSGCKDVYRPSFKALKRTLEEYKGNNHNAEALNMEDKRQKRLISSISKKVDDVIGSREILSEKYKHDILYTRVRGYNNLERANVGNSIVDCPIAKRSKQNVVSNSREILSEKYKHGFLDNRVRECNNLEKIDIGNPIAHCCTPERSEKKNSDNDACSVGSCSINDEAEYEFPDCATKHPCLDKDILYTDNDAKSFQSTNHKETSYHCLEEKIGITVHGLEMHAYRCTLGALYASGPLSWEQEELLTNLRIMLNITNDEYLTELRNLIPPVSGKLST